MIEINKIEFEEKVYAFYFDVKNSPKGLSFISDDGCCMGIGFSSDAFLTTEELESSLGPLRILIKIAKPIKIAASQPVILLKTFPAPCPPRMLLAAWPPKVPDKPPPWLACIKTTDINNILTIV